jgi:hypothetical protein
MTVAIRIIGILESNISHGKKIMPNIKIQISNGGCTVRGHLWGAGLSVRAHPQMAIFA